MQRGSILSITTVMVFVAIGVQGTSPNNTQVSITRDGCGTTKLCVEVPDNCDPAGNDSCLFTSMNASQPLTPNGVELGFELSGNSAGYIAVGLTMNATQGTPILFICGQDSSKGDNEKFFFQTMQRDNSNNELTKLERNVTEIRGVVKDNLIQCEFNVPNVNAATTTRSSQDTAFTIILGSGEVNGTDLGNLNVTLTSSPVDVPNPSSTTPTTPTTTTTATTANVTTTTANVTTNTTNTTTTESADPGNLNVTLTSSSVDVTNLSSTTSTTPATTTTNTAKVTTTTTTTAKVTTTATVTPTTESGASGALHPRAVLFLLSVLTLSVLKTD